jgi:STE24 endopeptidase
VDTVPLAPSRSARAWWAAAVVLALLGVAAVLTHPAGSGALAAGPGTATVGGLDVFDAEVLAEVAAYRGPRRAAGLVLLVLAVGVPLTAAALLVRRPAQDGQAAQAAGDAAARPRQVATIVGLLVLAVALVRLPLLAWVRVVHDGRFAMRNQSGLAWLGDHLLAVGTRALLAALAAAAITMLVQHAPQVWPAQLTVAASVVAVLVVLLHPVVVHPLLLPERALPPGEHRDAVHALVTRSAIDVPVTLGVASTRTPRRNAVATGIGPTQRIVLHDTLLELAPADVAAITAHELAHVEHRDLVRGVLATAPVVLAGALLAAALLRRTARRQGSTSRAPTTRTLAAALALVLAAEALATPLVAAGSRRIEAAADARAVVLAGSAEPLLVTLRAFTVDDLADPEPPGWAALLSTHPSVGARIRAVVAVAERAGLPVDVAQVLSAEASHPARR